MRLKLYRAASMAQAMSQVRTDLGPDALILSTRRTGDGVELTAAIDPDEVKLPALPLQTAPVSALGLCRHGLTETFQARLAVPNLKGALSGLLRFGPLPCGAGGAPLESRSVFVGLPGAGKTLSVARLATQMVLAGTRPVVITADGRRAGAAEQLGAYTRLLGLDLLVASTPSSLRRALGGVVREMEARPVLIDTPGLNPFSASDMAASAELLQAAGAEPVLVMAAGQDALESVDQAQAFAAAGVRHMMVTRLDLARRLGGVVMAAADGPLMLTVGSEAGCATVPAEPMTAAWLAGRLSEGSPQPVIVAGQAVPPRRPIFPAAMLPAANAGSRTHV